MSQRARSHTGQVLADFLAPRQATAALKVS
jgi:hypothetical protein